MKLVAISFGISAFGREIIENIATNIFKQPIEICDLKSTEPDWTYGDRVLIFGKKAAKLLAGELGSDTLLLPDLKKLEPGNESERKKALESLTIFRDNMLSSKPLTENSLPTISCDSLIAIENSLKEKKENSWKGRTKDGRSVEIQLVSAESKAEIVLTFAELYAIKSAMKVLDLNEIIIS